MASPTNPLNYFLAPFQILFLTTSIPILINDLFNVFSTPFSAVLLSYLRAVYAAADYAADVAEETPRVKANATNSTSPATTLVAIAAILAPQASELAAQAHGPQLGIP